MVNIPLKSRWFWSYFTCAGQKPFVNFLWLDGQGGRFVMKSKTLALSHWFVPDIFFGSIGVSNPNKFTPIEI